MVETLVYYPDPSTLLGPADARYFPTGHKRFRWAITEFTTTPERVSGLVGIHHPSVSGTVHVGSMEYASLASLFAEYALPYLAHSCREQIGAFRVTRLKLKITESVEFTGSIEIPFCCSLPDANLAERTQIGNGSLLDIRIGGVAIRMEVARGNERRPPANPAEEWPLNAPTIHDEGYRWRDNSIRDIAVDLSAKSCSASVTLRDEYPAQAGEPIGLDTARTQYIPTDILCITGQLMQVLLHTLHGTQRTGFPNIWLREADMHFEQPVEAVQQSACVRFNAETALVRGGQPWRAIALESRVGTIHSTFKIAHQIPAP